MKNCCIKDVFAPQNNGEFSESIIQNWTLQAIECYELCADCAKYSISRGNYSFICQMPKVVKQLIKAYGVPSKKVVRIF